MREAGVMVSDIAVQVAAPAGRESAVRESVRESVPELGRRRRPAGVVTTGVSEPASGLSPAS